MKRTIALITDFGLKDNYVASMKAVILARNPYLNIVDISHEITPQNILEGLYILRNCYSYFPRGTIFVVVVDPGVGSQRKIICIKTKRYLFLAPDNGILSFISDEAIKEIHEVSNKRYFMRSISNTFHGRDIFAPVAAYLSKGLKPSMLGRRLDSFKKIRIPSPKIEGKTITGSVILIDKFGNLITNVNKKLLKGTKVIQIKNRKIKKISNTYAQSEPGSLIALIGSSGTLEISMVNSNAAKALGVSTGDHIFVKRR
jgi:hypothetical protein